MALSQSLKNALYGMVPFADARTELQDLLTAIEALSSTEAGYIDGVTAGTGAASKALVLDANGDVTMPDLGSIGFGGVGKFSWDTSDANANKQLIQLPAGGGTDVPVIVIGQSIEGVDMAIHNGITEPTVCVLGVGAVATGPRWEFRKSRGTAAAPTVVTSADDIGQFDFYACVAAGEWVRSAQILAECTGTVATTRGPGVLTFLTATDAAPSVLTTAMRLNADQTADFGGAARPIASDGGALGSATLMWSDLFLASGGVINFNNGNVTLTHAAGDLTLAGATTVKLGAVTLNVTGTRLVQSYHTNLTSTNAVTVDSSETVKDNIANYDGDAVSLLNKMDVITYRHKPELDPSGAMKLGIRAESVAEPLAIDRIGDGDEAYPGVNLYGLMTLLVKAVQQLSKGSKLAVAK